MDFGYKFTVETSSLLALPDSLTSVTRFTIRCHFADIVPAGDPSRWSQTSCDALKSLVLNKTCYLVVKVTGINNFGFLSRNISAGFGHGLSCEIIVAAYSVQVLVL